MSNKLINNTALLNIKSAINSECIAISHNSNMLVNRILEYSIDNTNGASTKSLKSTILILQHKSNMFSECLFEALDIITSSYYNFYVKKLPINNISKLGRKVIMNITPFKMLDYIDIILDYIRHSYVSDSINYNRQHRTFSIFLFCNKEGLILDTDEIYDVTGCIRDNGKDYMSSDRISYIINSYIEHILNGCSIYIQKLLISCFIYQISSTTGNSNSLRSNYLLINKGYDIKINKTIVNDINYVMNKLYILYRDCPNYTDIFSLLDTLCCNADDIPKDNNSSYYNDISKIDTILKERELSSMIDYRALTKDEYTNQLQAWANLGTANHILIDKRHRLKLIRFNNIPYEICFLDFKVNIWYGHIPILFILEYTDTTYTKVKNILHITQHIVDALDFNFGL